MACAGQSRVARLRRVPLPVGGRVPVLSRPRTLPLALKVPSTGGPSPAAETTTPLGKAGADRRVGQNERRLLSSLPAYAAPRPFGLSGRNSLIASLGVSSPTPHRRPRRQSAYASGAFAVMLPSAPQTHVSQTFPTATRLTVVAAESADTSRSSVACSDKGPKKVAPLCSSKIRTRRLPALVPSPPTPSRERFALPSRLAAAGPRRVPKADPLFA